MNYIIDACALIDASKNYPINMETFEPIWNKLDEMINEGRLLSSIEVKFEILDEDLLSWLKNRKSLFVPLDRTIQEKVTEILCKFPNFIKLTSIKNSNADPFLVATARIFNERNVTVVTNERKSASNADYVKIPNVCHSYNIRTINLNQFIKEILD